VVAGATLYYVCGVPCVKRCYCTPLSTGTLGSVGAHLVSLALLPVPPPPEVWEKPHVLPISLGEAGYEGHSEFYPSGIVPKKCEEIVGSSPNLRSLGGPSRAYVVGIGGFPPNPLFLGVTVLVVLGSGDFPPNQPFLVENRKFSP
jgi:hypothetical protein